MGRDENVIVFKDTENLCKTNPRISEAVKRSISAQKLILEGDKLENQKKDHYNGKGKDPLFHLKPPFP